MIKVQDRFLKYVAIDTESVYYTPPEVFPSSEKQKDLAVILVEELKELGIVDARTNEYGYVYATIPSNTDDSNIPAVGFIAHMDTTPDMPGQNIKPHIVENYDGKDIVLNKVKNIVMKTSEFAHLLSYVGQDLIVTDGTTLLGADDKSGIAEIMTMAEYFVSHPKEKHGDIKIAFTPDEEVGSGADHFDVDDFAADFAYTVDGGKLGDINYESFNAATAKITINGVSIHPGSAKNKMVNSILIAQEFQTMLPVFENPASTEKYEGFSHLNDISGNVEKTVCSYIIRDHDRNKFEVKKERFFKIADYLNDKYGEGTVELTVVDSYYNMGEKIKDHIHIVDTVKEAMKRNGIEPDISPIRGGTDGSRLSFMGLPCPNICTGGHNAHGKYEYISIHSMEKTTEVLKDIIRIYAGE